MNRLNSVFISDTKQAGQSKLRLFKKIISGPGSFPFWIQSADSLHRSVQGAQYLVIYYFDYNYLGNLDLLYKKLLSVISKKKNSWLNNLVPLFGVLRLSGLMNSKMMSGVCSSRHQPWISKIRVNAFFSQWEKTKIPQTRRSIHTDWHRLGNTFKKTYFKLNLYERLPLLILIFSILFSWFSWCS